MLDLTTSTQPSIIDRQDLWSFGAYDIEDEDCSLAILLAASIVWAAVECEGIFLADELKAKEALTGLIMGHLLGPRGFDVFQEGNVCFSTECAQQNRQERGFRALKDIP